jgi:hypothetical protein
MYWTEHERVYICYDSMVRYSPIVEKEAPSNPEEENAASNSAENAPSGSKDEHVRLISTNILFYLRNPFDSCPTYMTRLTIK